MSTPVLVLALLSPLLAIVVAVFSYVRHRRRIEPERRISALLYVLAAIVCGEIAGVTGIFVGIDKACAGPNPGNLCGLVGFLVTGPIAGSLGVVLVALGLQLVRPEPRRELL